MAEIGDDCRNRNLLGTRVELLSEEDGSVDVRERNDGRLDILRRCLDLGRCLEFLPSV